MRSARQNELFVPLHPKASSVGHQEQICFQYTYQFIIKDNSHTQARNLSETLVWGVAYICIYKNVYMYIYIYISIFILEWYPPVHHGAIHVQPQQWISRPPFTFSMARRVKHVALATALLLLLFAARVSYIYFLWWLLFCLSAIFLISCRSVPNA